MDDQHVNQPLFEARLRWNVDGTFCVSYEGLYIEDPWRAPWTSHVGPLFGLDRALGSVEEAMFAHSVRTGRRLTWVSVEDDAGPSRTEPPLPL